MSISVEKNVEVTMRDGVVLRADVYRPAGPGRFPVLVQRTPYNKEMWLVVAATLDPLRDSALVRYIRLLHRTPPRLLSAFLKVSGKSG